MRKIGVLGYGSIGKRHVTNLRTLDCDVWIYDPIENPISQRDRLLNWADAVVVASPTSEHWSDICHVNRFGKPMFVEKPLGHTGAPINTLMRVEMIGYNLRFHSCVKKAKKWLEENKIGRIHWANFTCAQFNGKPEYLRDGVILNWSHEIDLALYLLGRARVLYAAATPQEDIADIILRHPAGCQTSIHLDYVTDPEIRGFTIAGTEGTIVVDLRKRSAILHRLDGVATVFAGPDSYDENYVDEMRAFLMRLDGQPILGCTAQEGLDVLDICLKAKEMAR